MNEKSFLPDGQPVESYSLASVQYRRDHLAEIAGGMDPEEFQMPANIEPVWGLLYATDTAIGFFVHPSESPMAIIFKNAQGMTQEAINLVIPGEDIVKAELMLPRQPKTSIGKILSKYSSKPIAELHLVWKNEGKNYRIFFFIIKDLDAFAASLEKYVMVSRTTKKHR